MRHWQPVATFIFFDYLCNLLSLCDIIRRIRHSGKLTFGRLVRTDAYTNCGQDIILSSSGSSSVGSRARVFGMAADVVLLNVLSRDSTFFVCWLRAIKSVLSIVVVGRSFPIWPFWQLICRPALERWAGQYRHAWACETFSRSRSLFYSMYIASSEENCFALLNIHVDKYRERFCHAKHDYKTHSMAQSSISTTTVSTRVHIFKGAEWLLEIVTHQSEARCVCGTDHIWAEASS